MTDPIASTLGRYMDLLSTRQRLVASNLANIDTPGYKTKDIDFQAAFTSALDSEAPPTEVQGLLTKSDGNNVNLDRENRLLSENTMRFQVASQLMRGHARMLRSAITEGR